MATLSSVTHIPVLSLQHLFKPYTTFYITNLILHLHLFNFTFSIPITPSDTENYLPSDDPNITTLMVSHYDCAKQHNLRQSFQMCCLCKERKENMLSRFRKIPSC